MFKKVKCEICSNEIGFSKVKYKDGYLCCKCHKFYFNNSKHLFARACNIHIAEVKSVLEEIKEKDSIWKSDLDMFNKSYSDTFFVDEINDRIIISGIEHKFKIGDIIKYDIVEHGTSSEVKEILIQIITSDEEYNNVKIRVVKAALNSTYKKTEWGYRLHMNNARQLIADLETIKAKYDGKQLRNNIKIESAIDIVSSSNVKFCTQCGNSIVVGNKFCGECGNKL